MQFTAAGVTGGLTWQVAWGRSGGSLWGGKGRHRHSKWVAINILIMSRVFNINWLGLLWRLCLVALRFGRPMAATRSPSPRKNWCSQEHGVRYAPSAGWPWTAAPWPWPFTLLGVGRGNIWHWKQTKHSAIIPQLIRPELKTAKMVQIRQFFLTLTLPYKFN